MEVLSISAIIVVFLYLLNDTDMVPEYAKVLNFKWLKYEDYFNSLNNSPIKLNYLEYISFKYPSFWTKLVSCPTCLSVWVCLVMNFLCKLGWYNLGFQIIIVWVGYAALSKLLRKLYE
jgi:hypothetical protein